MKNELYFTFLFQQTVRHAFLLEERSEGVRDDLELRCESVAKCESRVRRAPLVRTRIVCGTLRWSARSAQFPEGALAEKQSDCAPEMRHRTRAQLHCVQQPPPAPTALAALDARWRRRCREEAVGSGWAGVEVGDLSAANSRRAVGGRRLRRWFWKPLVAQGNSSLNH